MSSPVSRSTRLAGVTVATVMWLAPPASAVSPPPIDDSFLPPPRPPAAARPTEPREPCVTPAHATVDATGGQLDGLELPAMWALTRGAGQTVAVIDTGVERHRLLPHLIPGGDYVHTGDGTDDCDGHGTVVAGIIGAARASNGFGGIAPDATIVGIRQSSTKFRPVDQPSETGFGDVETLAMAVRNAADMGATVINISSVACLSAAETLDDRALGAALSYAVDVKNVVVVSAAGNVGGPGQCPQQNPPPDPAGPAQPDWNSVRVVVSPAWYDQYVLTVGSVGADGVPSRFSLGGPWVDVAAPGEAVVSLDPDGEGLIDAMPGYDGASAISGTSYAAPVVTGIAALVRSRWPQLTARQVMQRIEETAHHPAAGWDPLVGSGTVDPLAAVSGGTGGPRPPNTDSTRATAEPVAAPNPMPRRVALIGAAICVAITGVLAITASRPRLGVRDDGVAHD